MFSCWVDWIYALATAAAETGRQARPRERGGAARARVGMVRVEACMVKRVMKNLQKKLLTTLRAGAVDFLWAFCNVRRQFAR